MEKIQEKISLENLIKALECSTHNLFEQSKDNLFSANHRGQMIRKYGYSESMKSLEDLCLL